MYKTLVKEYIKKHKVNNFDKTCSIANKLFSQYHITVTFSIDCIYFVDWRNDNVLYCFNL